MSGEDHPDNVKESAEGFLPMKERPRYCTDCICLVQKTQNSIHSRFHVLVYATSFQLLFPLY